MEESTFGVRTLQSEWNGYVKPAGFHASEIVSPPALPGHWVQDVGSVAVGNEYDPVPAGIRPPTDR